MKKQLKTKIYTVKLNVDLTRYDKRLTIGREGKTIAASSKGDRYELVDFGDIVIDIITDEKYLEELKERNLNY